MDGLGEKQEVTLSAGTVRYLDVGTGVPLIFVHGLLANSTLWREVIPTLATRYRCIAPDLPLGGHAVPMRAEADLTPAGVAGLLGELLDALHLHDVTLVGNDTGGAICQVFLGQHPERVARLVLTNCDAFEQFFPATFRILTTLAVRFGDGFGERLRRLLRSRRGQRALMATVSRHHYDDATLDAYFASFLNDPAIRHDAVRVMAAVSARYTVEAATTFGRFSSPVLLAWGTGDLLFTRRLGKRLAAAFPHATLRWVAGSRAFVPEDQPQILLHHLQEFLDVTAAVGATAP